MTGCAVDKFSVVYPTPKCVILAGRQTIRGLGLIDSRIDVLLKLDGVPCLQDKLVVDSFGKWKTDFLLTQGSYVLHVWFNTPQVPCLFDEMRSPPPDLIVNFSVWQA